MIRIVYSDGKTEVRWKVLVGVLGESPSLGGANMFGWDLPGRRVCNLIALMRRLEVRPAAVILKLRGCTELVSLLGAIDVLTSDQMSNL